MLPSRANNTFNIALSNSTSTTPTILRPNPPSIWSSQERSARKQKICRRPHHPYQVFSKRQSDGADQRRPKRIQHQNLPPKQSLPNLHRKKLRQKLHYQASQHRKHLHRQEQPPQKLRLRKQLHRNLQEPQLRLRSRSRQMRPKRQRIQ